jgi:Glycosyltransferase family 87
MTPSDARSLRRSNRLYRLAIPAAALAVFAVVALFWATGLQAIPEAVLRTLGVEPGPIPFLDTHAILAAAQCQRHGIDVYLSDPCDLLGRPHVYSPLWLALVPPPLGTAATPWIGAGLDLLFILALPIVMPARGKGEMAILALAVFSPMTLYALERGNNDLVIFLLVLSAGLLLGLKCRWRLCGYALLTGAALLKYYPAVLLALAGRERRRRTALIAGGAVAAFAIVVAYDHDPLFRALANIPRASYYTDAFSAQNLPFGLVQGLPNLIKAAPLGLALFAVLAAFAVARAWRTARLLDAEPVDWTTSEVRFAAIGGLLLTGCFFAAQNIDYRGVFFLFVLPGLLQLRGAALSMPARQLLSRLIAAVVFLMWEEFFRSALPMGSHVFMLFWVLRELLWWWLIAGLAAIAGCHLARLPLLRDSLGWLGRTWPAIGKRATLGFRAGPTADR